MLAYVIPVLNCLEYTKQAIASIRFEPKDLLFVIDNGSTDGTHDWLLEWAATAPVRSIIRRAARNLGVAASWNMGLAWSFENGYDRVVVMNNDVVLAADTVPALHRCMDRFPGGAIVSAQAVPTLHALDVFDRRPAFSLPVDYSCFMITRGVVDRVGWFDEAFYPAYWEDQDYDCRVELAGIPRGFAGDAIVCHYHSRTLHEGHIPNHERSFEANRQLFLARWGDYIRGGRQHAHGV